MKKFIISIFLAMALVLPAHAQILHIGQGIGPGLHVGGGLGIQLFSRSDGFPELVETNSDFSEWSGDNPIDYSVQSTDVNNYITEDASGGRFVSDNSQAAFRIERTFTVTGSTRYQFKIVLSDYSSGDVRLTLKDNTGDNTFLNLQLMDWGSDGIHFYNFDTPTNCVSLTIRQYQSGAGLTDYVVNSWSLKQVKEWDGVFDTEILDTPAATSLNYADISGACYVNRDDGNGDLIYIINQAGQIVVTNLDGTIQTSLHSSGIITTWTSDFEAICWIGSDSFAILDEASSRFYTFTATTATTAISTGDCVRSDLQSAVGNGGSLGVEGIEYNNGTFYIMEQSTGYQDGGLWAVIVGANVDNHPDSETRLFYHSDIGYPFGYDDNASDIHYNSVTGTLFMLSRGDVGQSLVLEVDTLGRLHSYLDYNDSTQREGIALKNSTGTMVMVGEPTYPADNFWKYIYELVETNSDFSLWSGDNPIDYTVQNEDGNNYITEDSTGANWVSDGTQDAFRLERTFTVTPEADYTWTVDIGSYVEGDFRIAIKDNTGDVDILPIGGEVGWNANGSYETNFTTPIGCVSIIIRQYQLSGATPDTNCVLEGWSLKLQ